MDLKFNHEADNVSNALGVSEQRSKEIIDNVNNELNKVQPKKISKAIEIAVSFAETEAEAIFITYELGSQLGM